MTLVVRDYDEAIRWFVDMLGFEMVEDRALDGGKRWVVVAPPGVRGAAVLLARAVGWGQEERVGHQTGGRVAFFLYCEDFSSEYDRMLRAGVTFEEEPREEEYGRVAVFRDLYGNRWDLIGNHRDHDHEDGLGRGRSQSDKVC